MGVIIRQGIKSTLVNYLGAIVGALAILFVYPLNDEIYGYAQWLYSFVFLLIPFATGGALTLLVKYFPSFSKNDKQQYNGLLSLVLVALIAAFGLFLLVWYFAKDDLVDLMIRFQVPNAEIINQNEKYILILLALMILLKFLISQSTNSLRIVVPELVDRLGFKLYLPTLILIYIYFDWGRVAFNYGLIGFFVAAVLIMIGYLLYLKVLKFGKLRRPPEFDGYSGMAKFAMFGSLNQIGNSLAWRLDTIMIPFFLGMAQNGFFSKTAFIANMLEYPTRSLGQIAAPIISKAWQEDDRQELDMIYKKASINLFLLGGLVFIVLWFILEDVISLSVDPSTFPNARMIFLILASSKLIDMLTSVNTHIIIYSPKYRYNLIFLLILGVSNIILNIKLIPLYGITGAAIATAISLFFYNLIKLIFIYTQYRMQPFSVSNLKTLVLLLVCMALYMVFPDLGSPFFNIIAKSIVVGTGYIVTAYYWRISEDSNRVGINLLRKVINLK